MTLPSVEGWVIDIRTAKAIFASSSNLRIAHCVEECKLGRLHICHCEEADFKNISALKDAFFANLDCVVVPDDDIMQRCNGVSAARPHGKRRLIGNESAVFLTAIAASRNYGLISDHCANGFATAYDLCCHFGIPALRSDEYFDLL